MKLHFACLVDGLREDELGGEKALELRTPRRACCNLYDIIHCRAPEEWDGVAAVVAVPRMNLKTIEDQE